MLTYGHADHVSRQMVLLGGMAICVETVYLDFAGMYPVLLEGAPPPPPPLPPPLPPPPPHHHHYHNGSFNHGPDTLPYALLITVGGKWQKKVLVF